MTELYDPMGDLARSEAAWSHGDAPWFAYCAQVEAALGLERDSLDGTEEIDGHSLDSAYDAYRVGISAKDYACGSRRQPGQPIVRR